MTDDQRFAKRTDWARHPKDRKPDVDAKTLIAKLNQTFAAEHGIYDTALARYEQQYADALARYQPFPYYQTPDEDPK